MIGKYLVKASKLSIFTCSIRNASSPRKSRSYKVS